MDDSWTTPKWAATIVGRAHLATWEWLLNEFAKNRVEPIVTCITQLWQVLHVTGCAGVV